MFNQATFLGASVRGVSAAMGWGMGQASQLTVSLVEDPANGDLFQPQAGLIGVGQPVHFQLGGFSFGGLLQKYERKQDSSGKPVYEVVCVDPREILDGVQLILGGYNGDTGGVKNLLNVYGWWEAVGGYGASLSNETGMPWGNVQQAVLSLVNQPLYGSFGGPLSYRGYQYSLDLSEVPNPPDSYRIPGPSMGLLEAIAMLCEDGGCQFFVELDGFEIRVRTASMRTQPPLGTIMAYANANFGTLIRSTSGVEARNEVTSSFLIGGEVTDLQMTNGILSFWGDDFDGNPIFGIPDVLVLKDINGNTLQTVNHEIMTLNASPVADILGGLTYPCSTTEMRLALVNMESWAAYMRIVKPQWADRIGLLSPVLNMGVGGAAGMFPPNLKNDNPDFAKQMAIRAVTSDLHVKEMRMYEFVRGYANEYMGRKFLVPLPFLLQKVDSETLRVTNSYDVTDGGFLMPNASPLGLTELNQDIFRTPDDRFKCFVVFNSVLGVDLSKVSPQGSVIQDETLYMEAQADSRIIFAPSPYAIVTLPGPVFEEALDTFGGTDLIGGFLQQQPAVMQGALKKGAFGNVGMRIAPATRGPDFAAVPLKSNILTYGPWFAAGAPGKVKFEQDSSLTPWGYGSYDAMNLAGETRVATAVTNLQLSETGSQELAGMPLFSLGDVLLANGPNITNIDINYGTQGVTTNYRMATFTPRFGVFARGYQERLRRLSLTGHELRRSLRASIKERVEKSQVVGGAIRTAKAFMENAPKAINRQHTPHDCLVSCSVVDGPSVRTGLSTMTVEESIPFLSADVDADFQSVACMSWSGLFRPFSTSPGSGVNMSSFTAPTITTGINSVNHNPWGGWNDVEFYTQGNTYQGLHAFRRGSDGTGARVFALRGPLVVSGWGLNVDGTCTPGTGNVWNTDLLQRPDRWKTGPVDLLWDQNRGVWTCHGTLRGTSTTIIPAGGGSGTMATRTVDGVTWNMLVWNDFSTPVAANSIIQANYIATDNRWYVVAADCQN